MYSRVGLSFAEQVSSPDQLLSILLIIPLPGNAPQWTRHTLGFVSLLRPLTLPAMVCISLASSPLLYLSFHLFSLVLSVTHLFLLAYSTLRTPQELYIHDPFHDIHQSYVTYRLSWSNAGIYMRSNSWNFGTDTRPLHWAQICNFFRNLP